MKIIDREKLEKFIKKHRSAEATLKLFIDWATIFSLVPGRGYQTNLSAG